MFSSVCSTISRAVYVCMSRKFQQLKSLAFLAVAIALLPSHDTPLNVFVRNKGVGVEEIRFGM